MMSRPLMAAPLEPGFMITANTAATIPAGYMATSISVLLLPSSLRAQLARIIVHVRLNRIKPNQTRASPFSSNTTNQGRFGGSGTVSTAITETAAEQDILLISLL